MIETSFCFLAGVGHRTERRWWQQGVNTWADFLCARSIPRIGSIRKAYYDEELRRALEHLEHEDARYFANKSHASDQWRLYEWLRSRAVYLDIDTNSFGQITVVGRYGHGGFTSLVDGDFLTRQ